MRISEVLEAVRTTTASSTGLDVTIGPPDESGSGLFILPYMLSEVPGRPQISPGTTGSEVKMMFTVHFLLMSSTPNAFQDLGKGVKSVFDNPIIVVDSVQAKVTRSHLDIEKLTAILESAGIKLRLVTPYEVQWEENWTA